MYRVVKCPECKTLQLTSTSTMFSCVSCNKKRPISKIKIYFESRTPYESQEVLKELKKKVFELNNEIQNSFSSSFDNKNL